MTGVPPTAKDLDRAVAALEPDQVPLPKNELFELRLRVANQISYLLERSGVSTRKFSLREARVVLASSGANDRTIELHARAVASLVRSLSIENGSWSSR